VGRPGAEAKTDARVALRLALQKLILHDDARRDEGENPTTGALDEVLGANANVAPGGLPLLLPTECVSKLLDIVRSVKKNIPQCKELYNGGPLSTGRTRAGLLSKACRVENVILDRFPEQFLSLLPLAKGNDALRKDKHLRMVKQTQNASVQPSKQQQQYEAKLSKDLNKSGDVDLQYWLAFLGLPVPPETGSPESASRQGPAGEEPAGLPAWQQKWGAPYPSMGEPNRDALRIQGHGGREKDKLLGELMVDSAQQDPRVRKRQEEAFIEVLRGMNKAAIANLDCLPENDNRSAQAGDEPAQALITPLEVLAQYLQSQVLQFPGAVKLQEVEHHQAALARLYHDQEMLPPPRGDNLRPGRQPSSPSRDDRR
jgi:hypothetical protein